jgi:ribosomal protein S24E
MELIKEKHNFLLNRKELSFKITELQSPPSMENAKKMVAEKLSIPEDLVHIEKVLGRFGTDDFTITAKIYGTSSERERFHVVNKKAKKPKKGKK